MTRAIQWDPRARKDFDALDRVIGQRVDAAIATIRSEFPSVEDFERDFPSASDWFFDGYYRDRVITVHSRQPGQEEDDANGASSGGAVG